MRIQIVQQKYFQRQHVRVALTCQHRHRYVRMLLKSCENAFSSVCTEARAVIVIVAIDISSNMYNHLYENSIGNMNVCFVSGSFHDTKACLQLSTALGQLMNPHNLKRNLNMWVRNFGEQWRANVNFVLFDTKASRSQIACALSSP